MADVSKAIGLISGGTPTPHQVQRVQAIAHALDIPNSDPLLPILVALDQYHGVFRELPDKMQAAADTVAKEAAAKTAHHVNIGLVAAIHGMGPQIGAALVEHAQALTHVDRAKWIGGTVIVSLLAITLAFWSGHAAGVDSGKADAMTGAAWMTTPAGQAALDAYRKSPEVAEWANSNAAKAAFALSSADLVATTGYLVAAAEAGVPVLLDGLMSVACALWAEELAPGAAQWFAAGHRSTEPAQSAALAKLGLEPLLDLGMRLGEGSGAVAAVPLVRSAVLILREMAQLADVVG